MKPYNYCSVAAWAFGIAGLVAGVVFHSEAAQIILVGLQVLLMGAESAFLRKELKALHAICDLTTRMLTTTAPPKPSRKEWEVVWVSNRQKNWERN